MSDQVMPMLKIFNTLTQKKEIFKPMNRNRVKLFVCGPTVYDNSHIGHARTYISFDMVARYLRYKGHSVFYLQNITDIDDKIIKRASEIKVESDALAREYEKRYLEDMKALNVENVNLYARATEHLEEIFKQIRTLIDKGYAYETDTGVYFDESKFKSFGKLSRRNIEDLNVHRVKTDQSKRNPGDFALWKKTNEKPLWDSPWGPGRPGWHIEDTAITEEYFGPQYDIHGGGLDLIFPHHEAEIAQMESASGKSPMVKYWMHTGFLNVKGTKMSKSLGNFITIRDLIKNYEPEVFRFLVLSTHYRSPIDFSSDNLHQAQKNMERIKKFLLKVDEVLEDDQNTLINHNQKKCDELQQKFIAAMDDDFNTPQALSILFEITRDINRQIQVNSISKSDLIKIKNLFRECAEILGINFNQKKELDLTDDVLKILLEVRKKLREKKEWELSDDIRNQLHDLGYKLEDK